MQAEPGRVLLPARAPVLSSCASGFLVRGLGLLAGVAGQGGKRLLQQSPWRRRTRGPPCSRAGGPALPAPAACALLSAASTRSPCGAAAEPLHAPAHRRPPGRATGTAYLLIRAGAEVDLVDVKGQTALYVAVERAPGERPDPLGGRRDPNGSRHTPQHARLPPPPAWAGRTSWKASSGQCWLRRRRSGLLIPYFLPISK